MELQVDFFCLQDRHGSLAALFLDAPLQLYVQLLLPEVAVRSIKPYLSIHISARKILPLKTDSKVRANIQNALPVTGENVTEGKKTDLPQQVESQKTSSLVMCFHIPL